MRVIGKEDLLEPLNRSALRIARDVADAVPGNFMVSNISNTNIWDPADSAKQAEVRAMFEEMVGWAVEEGADLIIGETFYYAGEALTALEVARASGLPVVLTLAPMAFEGMADGVGVVETAQQLEQAGADVVGLNCFRGPETIMPWLRQIREKVSCHVGALPIPYRTTLRSPPSSTCPMCEPPCRPPRTHVPDGAGSPVHQPLRARRLGCGGARARHQLSGRLLRSLAHAHPPGG